MILFITQTKLHDPDNGVIGNCYTACIASLFSVKIEDLADFEEMYGRWATACDADKPDDALCQQVYLEMTKVTGHILLQIDSADPAIGGRLPEGFSIACGDGPRGFGHAVIALDGRVFWDPHPDRTGLTTIDHFEVGVPMVTS